MADTGMPDKVLWTRYGNHGEKWYKAMVAVKSNMNHELVIESDAGLSVGSLASIDDISFTGGSCGRLFSSEDIFFAIVIQSY